MATNKITLKQIDAQIGTFSTNRAALQHLGHAIAMMIVYHCAPQEVSDDCQGSGDCTRMLKLASEMPKSWQGQMNEWCASFTPIRFNVANNKVGFDPKYRKLTAAEKLEWWKVAEAAETPFFELNEPDVVAKTMTFEEMVRMVGQLGKRIAKKIESGDVPDDLVPTAESLSQRLTTMKIVRIKPKNDNDTPAAKSPKNKAA